MGTVDGRLNFDTKIDTKGFSKGVNSLSGQINSLIGLTGKLAAALGAAFSVKQIIESAAEVKAAKSQFEQTFGEIQSQAESMINGVAKSSGILETRLKGVGTSIYAFAKTTGMDSASALYLMNDALQVTADSAAYYDRSLEDTAESLKSFLKGNFENDAALGLSCTETTRNAAANKLYGKSFIELSEAQKQMALLQMVKDANALSGAMGQAAREADGWENVIGNLKEAWKQLLATVGQPVLAMAVPVVQDITAALQKMTSVAQAAAKALSKVFGIDIGTDSTVTVSDSTADLSSNADSAAQSYKDMAASAEKAAEANENTLASFDKINKLGDTTDSKTGTNTALSPTTSSGGLQGNISVKADVDTSGVETKLTELFKDIKKNLNSLFKPLKSAWNKDGKKVTGSLKYAFKETKDLCVEIGRSFAKVWTNGTGEKTVGHILDIFKNINKTIGNISRNLKKAWSKDNLGTDIIQHAADIFNTILKHNENISKKISDWSEKIDFSPLLEALDELGQAVTPFADAVGKGLETFWDEVLLPMASWTIEDAIPTFLETLSDVITGLQKVWKTASPVIKDKLWDGFLKPIAKWTADAALSALSTLGDNFKKLCDNMTEKDVAVFLDLAGAVSAIYAAVKGKQKLDDFNLALKTMKVNAQKALTKLQELWALAKMPLTTPKVNTSNSTAIIPSVGIPAGTATQAGEAGAAAGMSFAGKFIAVVAAAIAGWEIGTAIRDAIGGDKIDEALFPIFDAIVNFFTVTIPEWWDTLQSDTLFPIYDKAVAAWDAVVKFFTESIPTFFTQTVPGWFSDLWTSIKDVFKNTEKWFGNKFETAWKNIKSAFSLSSVSSFFSGIWGGIKSAFGSVTKWFKDTFTEAWQGVKNVFSTGGKIFSGIKDGIADVFKDTVNTVIDGLNIVIAAPFNAINDAIGWIRDLEIAGWNPFDGLSEISIPQIPKLATGTVVPANYGEFMAILGDNKREAEIVSPLSTIKQAVAEVLAANGGTGGEIVIDNHIHLSDKEIHRSVVKVNKQQIRKTGRNPLAT